jgi:hypothetical protein
MFGNRYNSRIISKWAMEQSEHIIDFERYLALVRRMECHFKGFMVEYIERSKKSEADELAKATVRNTQLPPDVFF